MLIGRVSLLGAGASSCTLIKENSEPQTLKSKNAPYSPMDMGKNMFVRDMPQDLYKDLRELKKILGCKTWVTLMYEMNRRVRNELREQGIPFV